LFFSIIDPTNLIAETLSVKSQKLNLRSGPGENYSVKCVYSKGFPLKVLEKKEIGYRSQILKMRLDGHQEDYLLPPLMLLLM